MTGTRTASGHTIVANDTHLAMKNPATWHEVHLQLTDKSIDVYGYGVPGMPVMPAGFNAHVAWGVTLGYTNAMDLVAYPMAEDGKSFIDESFSVNEVYGYRYQHIFGMSYNWITHIAYLFIRIMSRKLPPWFASEFIILAEKQNR